MCGFRRPVAEELLASIWTSGLTECHFWVQKRRFRDVRVTSALPLKADRHRNGRHLSKVPVAVIPAFPLHEMRVPFCCCIRHRALRTFFARRKPENLVEASRVVLPPRLLPRGDRQELRL